MGEMTGGITGVPAIRLYREADRDSVFDVCMRTG